MNNTTSNGCLFRFFNGGVQVDSWGITPAYRVSEYTGMQGKTCDEYVLTVPASQIGVPIDFTMSPMIVGNSVTDYSFTPYSNICPISGHTGLTAYRTGRNLLDEAALKTYENWSADIAPASSGGSKTTTSNKGFALPGIKAGETYTISFDFGEEFPEFLYFCHAVDGVSDSSTYVTTTGIIKSSHTFTAVDGVYYLRMGLTDSRSSFGVQAAKLHSPMLEPGSSASPYEPYAGESFLVTFPALTANLWDEEWEAGVYDSATGQPSPSTFNIRSKNRIPVRPDTEYFACIGAALKRLKILYYDADGNYLSYEEKDDAAFTTPGNCARIAFSTLNTYGDTYLGDISINFPATATSYVPYSSAVFGGTVDVVTGVLTADRALHDLGDSSWAPVNNNEASRTQGLFAAALPSDAYSVPTYSSTDVPDILSDAFIARPNWYFLSPGRDPGEAAFTQYNKQVYMNWSALSGKTNAEAKAALTGVIACYRLAAPVTFQLDPQTVQMLKGANNLRNDAGDSTVTYVGTEEGE